MATKKQMKQLYDVEWRGDIPEYLLDLRCEAKTRAGTPCKRRDLYRNGRCRLHGGLSTGPITEEGKRKVVLNLPNQETKPHERAKV